MGAGLRLTALLWFLVFFSTALFGAGSARADYWRPPMKPLDAAGFASDDQVAASAGSVSVEVVCPSRQIMDAMKRGARVTVQKPGLHDPGVLSTLLHDALEQIWTQCDTAMGSFGNSVGFVEIYAPDSAGGTPALVYRANEFFDVTGMWTNLVDVVAERQQQEAAAAEQQAEAQQAAEAAQQRAAQLAAQQRAAEADSAAWNAWWAGLWLKIKLAFLLAAGLWLATKWETFVRWYYELTPHPAADMIHAAINGGVELDGEVFGEVLKAVPGGSIEQQVRRKQAERLTALMRESNDSLRRKAEELNRKLREEAKYQAAHADLHQAALDQQLAAKRAEAFAKMEAFLKRNRPA